MTKYTDEGCIECGSPQIYAKHLCAQCYQRKWNKKRDGECKKCGRVARLDGSKLCYKCGKKNPGPKKKNRGPLCYRKRMYCPYCGLEWKTCKCPPSEKKLYCDMCGEKFEKPSMFANHYECWKQWCVDGASAERARKIRLARAVRREDGGKAKQNESKDRIFDSCLQS